MQSLTFRSALLVASALAFSGSLASAASAQEAGDRLGSIEKQIQSLQTELRHMKQEMAVHAHEAKAAQAEAARQQSQSIRQGLSSGMPQIPAGYALVQTQPGSEPGSLELAKLEAPRKKLPMGAFEVGGVTVTLGGFFEAAGLYRSRNQPDDIGSSFSTGIPERNSPLYHEPQYIASARQSRFTAAFSADPDDVTHLQGYFATDFLGAAPTANYNESNSWTPRIREAWISYARKDYGFYVLGGQTWSLLTMNKVGVNPLLPNLPLQIDPQYVVGFDWTRSAQFRVAKNLGSDQFWLAASIENPSTIYAGTNPVIEGSTINVSNAGIGVGANGVNYTNNFAPDVVVKATADFPIAHLEAYGVGRVFNDRVSQVGNGQSNTTIGGGAGAGAIVHVIPKLVDFQVSGLAGVGVGRYGTSQLPDATVDANGKSEPLPGYSAMAGLVGHPDKQNDLYAYVGVEHVSARYSDTTSKGKTTPYGYGNPLFSNLGCDVELSAATCTANTSGDAQITIGNWYKFLKGSYGTMQVGAQYSYTRRFVFQGEGATPKTDENMLFLSFRWYPFS